MNGDLLRTIIEPSLDILLVLAQRLLRRFMDLIRMRMKRAFIRPVSRPEDSVTSSKKGSGERNGDHSFNKDNVTLVKTINMFSVLSGMDEGEKVCEEPNLNVNYPFIDEEHQQKNDSIIPNEGSNTKP
ncbi:hypothetical protein Tco_1250577 [Tanacetum coccineum]